MCSRGVNATVHTQFKHRVGLIVWLYTPKYINKLKQYGMLHYVSRKLKYAVLYVDDNSIESTQEKLKKLHFVRSVEISYYNELTYEYDGLLDELDKKAKEVNKSKEGIELFSQLEK